MNYVQLLGSPRAQVGRVRTDFLPDKRYQLLAYLAYLGEWVSRDKLAYLFWPDVPTEQARHNLRQLLQRVGALSWPKDALEVEKSRIRWTVRTDLTAFRQALEAGKHDEVLSQYGGPLLSGLEGSESGEFMTWLRYEREHLHGRWREVLFARARVLGQEGLHEHAATLLRTLMRQDALDEEALQAFMQAAASAGRPMAALRAYREFSEHIKVELDLEPTVAVQALAKTLQSGDASTVNVVSPSPVTAAPEGPSAQPLPPTLPVAATSFIGREWELAELAQVLEKPECRLLTLTGPGGAGKSRMALQAALELAQSHPEGVYFVPLDALTSHRLVPTAVAEALSLGLRGSEDPLAQVTRHIGTKQVLLVLDNFEHLLEGVMLASTLLQACPGLTLLVTARERLNLAEEWLLPVEGLPYPKADTTSLEEAEAHDAVRLFAERATRVKPDFALTERELPHILHICQLVEGYPLGLELAAVWARLMPLAEIASEIEANLDFLTTSTRNIPSRHRSIRAAFEHSWQLLSPKEQEVLRRLSVFKGGFRREAAALVTGAPIAILAALVDKSLLRLMPSGRYDRHPLIYQYTQEKLAADGEEQARTVEKHGRHYLRALRQLEQGDSTETRGLQQDLGEELENLSAAWRWAVAEQRVDDLQHCAEPLVTVFQRRLHEAIELLAQGLELVKTLPQGSEQDERELELQLALGPALMATRGFGAPEVEGAYRRAWELCRQLEETPWRFPALWGQWVYYATRAEHRTAADLGARLLHLSQSFGDPGLQLEAHHAQWTTSLNLGAFTSARTHIEQGVVLYDPRESHGLTFRYGGHDAGVCCRAFAGPIFWSLGYPDQALKWSQEATVLARELSHPLSVVLSLYWSAMLHQLRREVQATRVCAEAAIALAEEQGHMLFAGWATSLRGWALVRQGLEEEGITLLRQGLNAYRATGAAMDQTHLLALLAEGHGDVGNTEEGLTVLAEALAAVHHTGERHYEAELHRLKGELLLKQGKEVEAELAFRQAIDVARRQSAKSWELRAATSLSHLLHKQGEPERARVVLAASYDWFTEGFDTLDLQEAKDLVAVLSRV